MVWERTYESTHPAGRDGRQLRFVIYGRNNAQDACHPGCGCCPVRGSSDVRTWTSDAPEVSVIALSGSLAEAEPGPRSLPVQSWQARDEAMGLSSSQMADERAERNGGGATSSGGVGSRSVDVHPSLRGSMECEYGQRVLRRSPDGLGLPANLRLGLHGKMGHGQQLARLGSDHGCAPGTRQRQGLRSLAKHGSRMRAHLGGSK